MTNPKLKAREWWIDPNHEPENDDDILFGDALTRHPGQGSLPFQSGLIHVIEYSAFARLEAENKRLHKLLEKK